MVKKKTYGLCTFMFFVFFYLCAQDTPQNSKTLFGPDVISTPFVEYSGSFTADGNEVFFARSKQQWASGAMKSSIYYCSREEGQWTAPSVVSFSGKFDDGDPHITADGKTLYFISTRPSEPLPSSADIWMTQRDAEGRWVEPVRLPYPINSEQTEYGPRTDASGNLYFASDRPGGYGQGDLYRSANIKGQLRAPINMGNTLNSNFGEWNLGIDSGGKTLLFEASQRKENVSPYGDLYISFKRNGEWTIPQNVKELNTSGSDLYPYFDENSGQLVYTSSDSLKSKDTNIYGLAFQEIQKKYSDRAALPKKYLLAVNRSAHNVSVFDLKTKTLIKSISTGLGPHEIAVSKNNRFAFVANYGSYPKPHRQAITNKELKWVDTLQHSLTKIDLQDFGTTTFSLPNSPAPHGIHTNIDGSLAWITDENHGKLREIDGNSGEVLKTYPTMPGSHIVTSSIDFSKLFVSNIESNTVSVIDRTTSEVKHIQTPKGPEGLAVSPDGQSLWILCNGANKIVVMDIASEKVLGTFDSQGKFPVKMAFVNQEAWVVNVFSKDIAIFDTHSFAFKSKIPLESSPLGICADQNQVFISLPRKNLIKAFDPKSRKPLYELSGGMEQDGMLILNVIDNLLSD